MNKRNLVIAGILVIALSVTGVTMAAHGNKTNKPKRSTTIVQDANSPSDTVTVESTAPETATPVATTDTPTTSRATTVQNDQTAPVASPYEQFHQSVIGVASQLAQMIAPNDASFVDTQWRCISRYLPQDETVDYYNARLAFFDFRDSGNGQSAYQYFQPSCQVTSYFP